MTRDELLRLILTAAIAFISPGAIGGAAKWFAEWYDAKRKRSDEESEESDKARIEDARDQRGELWEQYEKAYNRNLSLQDTNIALSLKYGELLRDKGIMESEKAHITRQLQDKQAQVDNLLQRYSTVALQKNEMEYYHEQEKKALELRINDLSKLLDEERRKYDELLRRIIALEIIESE